ncbi:exosome non-catalytic core subunit rrp46 [Coemansia sp. RSA 2706]|nr:exosome non-catalytic core subunit rrp46 [Coemansia sp. RSA 2711]KAJ1847429.1 exosome non-catalytic core subunit rrp46 [Coemansia sp. RSA 2708]KAJ2299523.1 exosome non-catalytic core subunit rrp46 [Coemansia sp. RSA 2706]KAJ2314995.1 exosome non-catalytic core subunit rrp46 [Coemansia sp. RSA 2705]KAJ2318426.1 exosome non-catalytic core subunit rrp46 [Coemansia sp. RSA 2704]KAJ2323609.1 exosome non-catalytic core subunit rrp46 [Coemansia sp. RSA 2702]KAJ2379434.1 exosome non-catalytic core
MSRPDRRDASQIRALHCVLGQLNRADGSAQFSAGNTSVLCGVYGPVDVKVYDEKLDRAHIEVKFRPDIGVPMTKDKWVESAIHNTFEREILGQLHPRTLVQINVQVRQGDGSVDAMAINATTLALIDAGIPLRATVAAATCAVLATGDIVVDPTQEEADAAQSTHTFAFSNQQTDGPAYVDSRGEFTMDQYDACYDMCANAVERILAFMRSAVEGKVVKENQIASS